MKLLFLKRFIRATSGRTESGVTLVESLVAVAVLGGGVLAMVLAMSGGAMAVRENDHQVTAQSLARSQMEYIKAYSYNSTATTYPVINSPADYGISVAVDTVPGGDTDIQKITANITRNGAVVMTIEDYKLDR